MMCCMMDRVWGRGADVGRLVGRGQVVAPWPPGGRLVRRDHVRGRPHLASRRPALVAGVERRLLGRYNLWREGRAVADPVAVPEPVLEQIFPKKIQIRIFLRMFIVYFVKNKDYKQLDITVSLAT